MTQQDRLKATARQLADDDIANGEADKKDRADLTAMYLRWLKTIHDQEGPR